jgi:hypothetical protein
MKQSTYDTLSMLAVIALVVFTVLAQHSTRAGYVFGTLVVLTAAALFAAYIRALPTRSSTVGQKTQDVEAAQQSESAVQREAETIRNAFIHRRLTLVEKMRVSRLHEEVRKEHLKSRRHLFYIDAVEHGLPDLKINEYSKHHLAFHPAYDPATIVANIVEKLCAATREPRLEFVLEPNGSFKIQQISAKRAPNELPRRKKNFSKSRTTHTLSTESF